MGRIGALLRGMERAARRIIFVTHDVISGGRVGLRWKRLVHALKPLLSEHAFTLSLILPMPLTSRTVPWPQAVNAAGSRRTGRTSNRR